MALPQVDKLEFLVLVDNGQSFRPTHWSALTF